LKERKKRGALFAWVLRNVSKEKFCAGPNPTTSEFTTATPVLLQARAFFTVGKIFHF
jgi:hypothetical protein